MDKTVLESAQAYLDQTAQIMLNARQDEGFVAALEAAVASITAALRAGHKILLAGNGGSAGDAQHIAGEFLSRLNFDRAPLPAIALTTDSSVLTAVGNDYGYEFIFERQILGLGQPGDIFIGISTSGRSPNIIKALQAARAKGLVTIGFCGHDPRDMGPLCDVAVRAPSGETPLIQQIHIVAAHIICGEVERLIFKSGTTTVESPSALHN